MTRYVTPRKMYEWISSYPVISGYKNMRKWPTYDELCNMFQKLVDSKHIGNVLIINYPSLRREGDRFAYNDGDERFII